MLPCNVLSQEVLPVVGFVALQTAIRSKNIVWILIIINKKNQSHVLKAGSDDLLDMLVPPPVIIVVA